MLALDVGAVWLSMRLTIHPDLRLPPSEVRKISLLDAVRYHAILDQVDEKKAEDSAAVEEELRRRGARS